MLTDPPNPLEFHLSRLSRERYAFDRDLLKDEGGVRQPDSLTIQELTARMNARLGPQGKGAKPGHLYAIVLIQHILHVVVDRYRKQREPEVFAKAEDWLANRPPEPPVEESVQKFGGYYTPLPVFRGERELPRFLYENSGEIPGRHALIEQMLLVYLANANPAAQTTRDLYDDREFAQRDDYLRRVWELEQFFAAMPTFGPKGQSLFDMLSAPLKASPDSLTGQLKFIRDEWADILGAELLRALLVAEDIVREDEKGPWKPAAFGQGPDLEYLRRLASRAMFEGTYAEPERFSTDTDWMPRVVLLAKSIYVWLDQLSRRYGRRITKLDEIPNEELDRLAHWGFTGLWLIGLWERSEASRKIKHLRGNTDAVASAYSLWDYRISGDLGGNEALANLRERALARGIRLASDLVPNHMGLDSKWVREHPDWFIQLDHPPYGAYHYSGPDLSGDPDLDLRVEDGYWSQTDAAVVFRRIDRRSGDTRYIYHGNDGTSMPWNDTAQLNFMRPDVREAVIQLIIYVAKNFPIIRFDAAMTLTKKHYQRLWFPEPGTGGAIPSRALHGLTRDEFDRQMPTEFWRDVVDRVAAEAPDTLLLAEAFWLLEGFFVRTLGMHRVYNSAFMNMLKMEENAKFRSVVKNTLEFDPRVLQRFVNFMNNPDEDTAVAQFGKGDKYFGVCLMMATMPGLPMFGHGQVEGLTEKYGHEYQRAYYDERADEDLVRRHEREIFPILRQRHLFSGAEHFLLYDVYRDSGSVDENVFAYSNGFGDARALVVFHNKWAETAGWIHTSAAYSVPDGDGRRLVRKSLAEGLGLRGEDGLFYILRDRMSGLEYLRSGRDLCEHGLFVHLRAYQFQVFTEFREVRDDAEHRWARLAETLNGRGVPSVSREFKRVYLAPLISAFKHFANADSFRALLGETANTNTEKTKKSAKTKTTKVKPTVDPAAQFAEQARPFLQQALLFGGGHRDIDSVVSEIAQLGRVILALPAPGKFIQFGSGEAAQAARDHLIRALPERRSGSESLWRILLGWLAVWGAGRLQDNQSGCAESANRLEDWLLSEVLAEAYQQLGADEGQAWWEVEWVCALATFGNIAADFAKPRRFKTVAAMLDDGAVRRLIGANWHRGVLWFHRESGEEFLHRLFVMAVIHVAADPNVSRKERGVKAAELLRHFHHIEDLAAIAEYQVDRMKTLLGYML
ncbi:MAG: alpha-amylase family glycosyl hydrolase [Calditrichota bacterium]